MTSLQEQRTRVGVAFFRHPLARHIAVILSIKALLLLGLFWLFFGPDRRPTITPHAVHQLIFPAPSPEGGTAP